MAAFAASLPALIFFKARVASKFIVALMSPPKGFGGPMSVTFTRDMSTPFLSVGIGILFGGLFFTSIGIGTDQGVFAVKFAGR